MDGAHDMGGVAWSGPVAPEPNEPVFHAEWERRAFAITLAMAMPGGWNIDMSRFAREDRPPADYLGMSYYQIWLAGLERLMLERGLVASDEIDAAKPLHPAKPVAKTLTRDGVAAMLHRGGPTERDGDEPCPLRHWRPRPREGHSSADPYAAAALCARACRHRRDAARLFTCFRTPTPWARRNPQWLYTVTFDGRELWGADGDPSVKTSVDAWESYLEPA